jgi:hypothetical protein
MVITLRYSHLHSYYIIIICIRTVIKCGYYLLSAYEIMDVLNYYLNLYVRLNNAVVVKLMKITRQDKEIVNMKLVL